jgi:hypothetical protein
VQSESLVSLSKAKVKKSADSSQIFQFGIKAREDIRANVYIPELLGLMASDTVTDPSELSMIAPYPYPTQTGPKEPRVIIGPLRLVNHTCDRDGACEKPNIKVSLYIFSFAHICNIP